MAVRIGLVYISMSKLDICFDRRGIVFGQRSIVLINTDVGGGMEVL